MSKLRIPIRPQSVYGRDIISGTIYDKQDKTAERIDSKLFPEPFSIEFAPPRKERLKKGVGSEVMKTAFASAGLSLSNVKKLVKRKRTKPRSKFKLRKRSDQ